MTRKDYVRAAEMIRTSIVKKNDREMLIDFFVDFFKCDNYRFSTERFRYACIPKGEDGKEKDRSGQTVE